MSTAHQPPVAARFVRLPSIAERKLGPDYSAPIRLDPRVLNQMQATIKTLGKQYVDTLGRQVHELLPMIADACSGDLAMRSKFYEIIHDVRGLAGTFGHPIVGKFAKALCNYMQDHMTIDATIVRFHVEAMRDALADAAADDRIADDTLQSLELLIRTTADARSPALKRPAR
tara:strand:+ start:2855 stop:3370 length:516 start_codon:yes stop_codon:yes gene_type:complete